MSNITQGRYNIDTDTTDSKKEMPSLFFYPASSVIPFTNEAFKTFFMDPTAFLASPLIGGLHQLCWLDMATVKSLSQVFSLARRHSCDRRGWYVYRGN